MMKNWCTVILWILNLTLVTDSYKILLIPALFKSHLNYFVPVGSALSEAGHEVYIILSEAYPVPEGLTDGGVKILPYKSPGGVCYVATKKFGLDVITTTLKYPGDPNKLGEIVAPHMAQECENLLNDDDLFEVTKKVGFDIALVDGLFFSRCLYLLPAGLDIPYATLTTFQEPWHVRNPALPSFVPFHYAHFNDKMTFFQRMLNTFLNLMWILTSDSNVPPLPETVIKKYPQHLVMEYKNLIKKSKLWFYNTDIVLDYPKPVMPNIVYVGGMSIRPPQPLPNNVKSFLDNAENGVIVVSFGSVLPDLPQHLNLIFSEAFKMLPQRVLWRISQKLDFPENVMAMPWLPQQDVIAHPNVKLLITHCGNNGQFEAMFYRVPMIGFPIMVDQHFNAKRIESKGYGTFMDIHDFDVKDLVRKIDGVLTNSSYGENLERASKVFKDRPDTPRQRVVFWMEHLVKYGGDDLRSSAMDLPWYSYLLLDVYVIFTLILCSALILFVAFVLLIVHCFKKKIPPLKKEKES